MSTNNERLAFGAGLLAALLTAAPAVAHAQFGGIFSAILGTITGPIGGALTEINQIRAEALKEEQQLLWPLALIHQAETYITTIKASYRGWMNGVFAIRINSASLSTPQNLESAFLSGRTTQIGNFSQSLHEYLWNAARNRGCARTQPPDDGHGRRDRQRRDRAVHGRRSGHCHDASDCAAN